MPLILPPVGLVKFPDKIPLDWTPKEIRGRGVFRVAEDIPVLINNTLFHIIPEGFESDGGSIPWYGRPWFDSWGRCGLPAVFHDSLLTTDFRKRDIDWLFLGALHEMGVSDFQATVMYLAVRTRSK